MTTLFTLPTQEERVLVYLYHAGSATARDIFDKKFINAPWKIVSNLRKSGYISTERVKVNTLDGYATSIARYSLTPAGAAQAKQMIKVW